MRSTTKLLSKAFAFTSAITLSALSGAWILWPNGTGYVGIGEIAGALGISRPEVRDRALNDGLHFETERTLQWNVPCTLKTDPYGDVTWVQREQRAYAPLYWVPSYNKEGVMNYIRLNGWDDSAQGVVEGDLSCDAGYRRAPWSLAKPSLISTVADEIYVNDRHLPNDKQNP